MSRGFRLLVLFWFLSLSVLYGQADSLSVYVQGKLIDAESGEAIPFAHILLHSKLKGLTSDVNGCFDISSMKSDSLFISSIGYENLQLAVEDLLVDSSLNIIRLSPKIYMLGEIKITQYPSYERLVEIVINPILSENEKSLFRAYSNLQKVGLGFIPRTKELYPGISGGPITGIYNLFSRTEKFRKKYIKLKEEEKRDLRFRKKINNDVICRITGLIDSVSITQFIKYCNFSESYLNTASEYELFTQIKHNYEAFRQEI